MKKRLYLAYGSNLNLQQMFYRCPTAEPVGTAMLDGYELLFKGSRTGSYLTIEPRKGSRVPVGVWAVSEADEKALDRYEGYPNFYYKRTLVLPVIYLNSGRRYSREAFVYIMHEDRPFGWPSDYYMDTCLDGYESFGFDYNYLYEARAKSARLRFRREA